MSFSEARVFDQNNNLVITKVHTNSNSSTVPVNCPGLIAPNGWPTCNASVPPPCGPGLPPSGGVPDPCFYQYLCSFPKLLKQFSVESIDLSPYYNQDVTIEFINSPCMTGQHLQYSLFGGFCFCKDCACTSWPSQISYNISPTAGTISSTGTIANNSSVVLPENMFLNFPAISAPCTGAGCQGNIVYELYSPTNSLIQAGNNGVDFSTVLKNQPCSNTGVYKLVIKGQCGTANCTTPFVVFISKPCSSTAMTVCGKPLCSADDTNTNSIILSVSGGTPPFTYLWSNGSILQNLTSVMPGQYSVTITDANGYKATASFNITCLPRCNFSQIAIPTKVITPGQSVMIGIAPEPGITYSWFSNPVGFTSSVANPTVSPVATTTYTLIRRNSNPGCPPKISTVLVTVN